MRFRAFAAASWLVLPALSGGCFVYGESLLEPTGTGGGGGGGATTTSSTGGTGQPCDAPEDCPAPASPCFAKGCVDGVCQETPLPNTELPDPTPGDCHGLLCDSAGGALEVENSSDVPDDQNKCTLGLCEFGEPTQKPNIGFACGQTGMDVCNDQGDCVECIADGDCASEVCKDYACAPATCNDNNKNGSESDVDCGGSCQDCATGKICKVNTDCKSGVCQSLICAPSCTDGVKNNTETDVDCGGAACGKCGDGATCASAADCQSAVCAATTCAAPTCVDGVKNGTETAIDCGGACASCPLDHLVINEVDYDQPNTDTLEFVEIYNATLGAVSLANLKLILVDGNMNVPYDSVDLSPQGSLAPGQYLVVGVEAVTAAAGALKLNIPGTSNKLQNGLSGGSGAPDGLALIDDATDTVIDVFSYEGGITTADLSMWGLGTVSLVEDLPLAADVADEGTGSLCRLPNSKDTNKASADWGFSTTSTPGAANVP